MHRHIIMLALLMTFLVTGCSMVTIERDTFVPDYSRLNPPQKKQLTLDAIGTMATASTEVNKSLAQIYYQGVEALDKKVEQIWELSYKIMGFLGVGWENIDWNDPEAVQKFFNKANDAVKEKEAQIHDLEKQVDDYNKKLLESQGEVKKVNGELEKKKGVIATIWSWIWRVIWISGILIVIVFFIERFTGIPILSMIFGGAKVIRQGIKKTVQAVEEFKEDIRKEKEAEGVTEAEKQALDKAQELLLNRFRDRHDEDVEEYIDKEREKLVKNKEI